MEWWGWFTVWFMAWMAQVALLEAVMDKDHENTEVWVTVGFMIVLLESAVFHHHF